MADAPEKPNMTSAVCHVINSKAVDMPDELLLCLSQEGYGIYKSSILYKDTT